jgi:SAM-dependent MidA family methyltransferase
MLLTQIIRSEIASTGPMPFHRFMELALYHPEHGYYTSGRAKVGRGGDFFTNVSVGPLFGRLLAVQLTEMATRIGEPVTIVEQGAHSGDLAADILSALQQHSPSIYEQITYHIVEPSDALAREQKEKLTCFESKLHWSKSLPQDFVGIHISNELPDAFPVHLVQWDGTQWHEQSVVDNIGSFAFCNQPLSCEALINTCKTLPTNLPSGYTTEVHLAAKQWLSDLAAKLQRGYVLMIDYGHLREEFYAPERTQGTLSAYSLHRREPDPLARPGEIDLTAHIDFSSLMDTATASGMKIEGFTDQHRFMVHLGARYFTDTIEPSEIRAFKTLMHPQFMGLAFKVLCLSKGMTMAPPLCGFHRRS